MQDIFHNLEIVDVKGWYVSEFSAGNTNSQKARIALEERYWPITEITERFNRQSVSYQLSKRDCLHKWLKYKEGFSAELVRTLLKDFHLQKGDIVADPFMGSGTTALVSMFNGYNSLGFGILPMSKIAIHVKTAIYTYNILELKELLKEIINLNVPEEYDGRTPEIRITKDGYPRETSRELAYYKEHFLNSRYSENTKMLLELCTLNALERISYSAKDGQYLRWDWRCPKIIAAAEAREKTGRKPFVVKLDKGQLPSLKEVLTEELSGVIKDIEYLNNNPSGFDTQCKFIEGSALFELPKIADGTVSAVISSPPYCNRYDYTRTYAMELAYLGMSEAGVRKLRQDLLSCTVENKSKIEQLQDYYKQIGQQERYERTMNIVDENAALQEINNALKNRNENGEINNKGVLKMVEGYFTELTFLFSELYRVCKTGAYVAFVNDNVRYAGEVIPVDFLTTNLAEQIGFTPVKIYTLKQQKGNSSQQMKKYGRVALRKSITIWKK